MNRSQARLLLGALVVVGMLEWIASSHVYRDRIADADWAAAREAVTGLPEGDAVALATDWLGPRARMEIPALAGTAAVARPDLRGVQQLHVLGLDDTWSKELDRDLGGLPRPVATATTELGPFTLSTYALPGSPALADWGRRDAALHVSAQGTRCRGDGPFRCTEGVVDWKFAEVDYRPRSCLHVAFADGVPVRIAQRDMPVGQQLRGHVAFTDFNRRLRNDTPARVVIRQDDAVVARFVVTDAEGWRAFVVPTSGGTASIDVEITVGVRGTWGKNGLEAGRARAVCFELRSFEEAP